MLALTVSGFSIDQFLFYGWISPKKEARRADGEEIIGFRRCGCLTTSDNSPFGTNIDNSK
jgi:16S rRNA C1402 (ribose-2'-O) methylase RsmI